MERVVPNALDVGPLTAPFNALGTTGATTGRSMVPAASEVAASAVMAAGFMISVVTRVALLA